MEAKLMTQNARKFPAIPLEIVEECEIAQVVEEERSVRLVGSVNVGKLGKDVVVGLVGLGFDGARVLFVMGVYVLIGVLIVGHELLGLLRTVAGGFLDNHGFHGRTPGRTEGGEMGQGERTAGRTGSVTIINNVRMGGGDVRIENRVI